MTRARTGDTGPVESGLRPGSFMRWRDATWRILPRASADPLDVPLVDDATGEALVARIDELWPPGQEEGDAPVCAPSREALERALAERTPPPPAPAPGAALPAYLLARADALIAAVEAIDRLVEDEARRAALRNEAFPRTTAVKRACSRLAPSVGVATYYRHRLLYARHNGERAAIAAALRRKTFNQTTMTRAQLHLVDTLILRYYARERPLRPQTVYHLLTAALARTGGRWIDPARCGKDVPQDLIAELLDTRLPLAAILANEEKSGLLTAVAAPSRSWFYGYLRWFKDQPGLGRKVIVARYGKAAWEAERLVFDTFVARATMPLQYTFADHWLLDAFTVDEATRSRVTRLWLTAIIDAYSRSVLGMRLGYEEPSIQSLQGALRHAIWPKTSHTALGIEGDWAPYGIMQQLFLDNAWAHHSHSLEQLARRIGHGGRYTSIDLVFRPPYKGRYGAIIERLFGNFSGQLKEAVPGAIRSGAPRDVRNAAKRATFIYEDMDWLIQRMIVRYQHTPHAELGGLTPHEKWAEGIAQTGAPVVPPRTDATDRLFWRLSPETRTLTRNGIGAFGMHYWSPDLGGLERIDRSGATLRYGWAYDPEDIGRIALYRGDDWVGDACAKELRLSDGKTRRVSLWERDLARDLAEGPGQAAVDELALHNEIDAKTAQRKRERRAEEKRARAAEKGAREAGAAAGAGRDIAGAPAPMTEPAATPDRADGDAGIDYTDLLAGFGSGKSGEGE